MFFDKQEKADTNDLYWRYGFDALPYHSECWVQVERAMGPNGPKFEKDKPGYRYRDWWCMRLVQPDPSWMFECPCGHVLHFHRWTRHRVTKKLGVNVMLCSECDCDCVLDMHSYRWVTTWLNIDPKFIMF